MAEHSSAFTDLLMSSSSSSSSDSDTDSSDSESSVSSKAPTHSNEFEKSARTQRKEENGDPFYGGTPGPALPRSPYPSASNTIHSVSEARSTACVIGQLPTTLRECNSSTRNNNTNSTQPSGRIAEDNNFVTERILGHKTYEEAYQDYMRGILIRPFWPACRLLGTHSKYVFLVRWAGFSCEEDTWEPEDNLNGNEHLVRYKTEHGLPEERAIINQFFSWNAADFAHSRAQTKSRKSDQCRRQRRKRKSSSSCETNCRVPLPKSSR